MHGWHTPDNYPTRNAQSYTIKGKFRHCSLRVLTFLSELTLFKQLLDKNYNVDEIVHPTMKSIWSRAFIDVAD